MQQFLVFDTQFLVLEQNSSFLRTSEQSCHVPGATDRDPIDIIHFQHKNSRKTAEKQQENSKNSRKTAGNSEKQ